MRIDQDAILLPDYDEAFSRNINLACPACGSGYLHQGKVEVFDRSEDSKTGIHVIVTPEGVLQDDRQDRNPSSRRDGLTIEFWCEICGRKDLLLIVVQHKGNTTIGWLW